VGHVQLPNRVLLLCSPCASRHQVQCSASRAVPGAHRVVGPGTHRGSGPREVHTTVRQTTKRDEDLFPNVHRPPRNGYVSIEELVREISHNKSGLFQPLSSFPLRRSFPRRGKITALTNLPLLTTTLGASRRRLAI
jgi:hypothetical protein